MIVFPGLIVMTIFVGISICFVCPALLVMRGYRNSARSESAEKRVLYDAERAPDNAEITMRALSGEGAFIDDSDDVIAFGKIA